MIRSVCASLLIAWIVCPTWSAAQDRRGEGGDRRSERFRQQERGGQGDLRRGEQQRGPGRQGQPPQGQFGQGRSPQAMLDGAILAQLRALDLTDKQREQVREFLQAQRANMNINRDPQERQRRQEIIERLRKEGLEGEELRRAVMRELGIEPPTRGGDRPRLDPAEIQAQMMQRRAELMEGLRGILTPDQMTKLEESLRNINRDRERARPGGGGVQPPNRRDRSGGSDQSERRDGGRRDGGGRSN